MDARGEMTCARCGDSCPRYSVAQTRCAQCEREVRHRISEDAARRQRGRFAVKDFTGTTPL